MKQQSKSIRLMGTIIDLIIEHESPETIMEEVTHQLKEYEQRFSANDPSSELMAVNKNAGIRPVTVHPQLYNLIKIGKQHSCSSASHLNIAIGPLVQSWRIGFDDANVPPDDTIKTMLKKTNPENISLDDEKQTVFLKEKGMAIDLGSLAKGYIADLVKEYLMNINVASALINLGGNIVALGPFQNSVKRYWNIGIQNPTLPRQNHLAMLKINNQSVVTSGIYERTLETEGETYHHILDPHTGYPITTDVVSLTIRSNQSLDGEIWTTRLFGKSTDEIIDTLNQLEGMEGLVITKDEKIRHTHYMFKE